MSHNLQMQKTHEIVEWYEAHQTEFTKQEYCTRYRYRQYYLLNGSRCHKFKADGNKYKSGKKEFDEYLHRSLGEDINIRWIYRIIDCCVDGHSSPRNYGGFDGETWNLDDYKIWREKMKLREIIFKHPKLHLSACNKIMEYMDVKASTNKIIPEFKIIDGDFTSFDFTKELEKISFEDLKEAIEWTQQTCMGKNTPRLEKYYGEDIIKFRNKKYGGEKMIPILKRVANVLQNKFCVEFKNVLCNYYRDGNDHIQWHSDNKDSINDKIISVSFGETRTFGIRECENHKKKRSMELKDKTVVIFDREANDKYEHNIKKEKNKEARINLTFRI